MTGTEKLYGDPVVFATKLKDRIYKELGFTVNIGISTNKLLAKMASDFEKPDRVHTLFPEVLAAPGGIVIRLWKNHRKKTALSWDHNHRRTCKSRPPDVTL